MPKKQKFRKAHKGRRNRLGLASRRTDLAFGSFGLKTTTYGWINSRQIEAARRAMSRYTKRGGKIWIRIFPDLPRTRKGDQSTMGGGKGAPEFFVAPVKPGTIIFEIEGVNREQAQEAMRLAAHKLPIVSKFVSSNE